MGRGRLVEAPGENSCRRSKFWLGVLSGPRIVASGSRGKCYSLPDRPLSGHSRKRPRGSIVSPGYISMKTTLHVLVAEDVAINQKVIRAILEKAGHTLHLADTGRAALAAYDAEAFDAVLMDVQMP